MPCTHTIIDMQGAAPSQAALQGSSQGQHPAALSQQAHVSGSANVAAVAHESPSSVATVSALSVVAEPASVAPVEPAPVASEPAASMVAEPASMATEPAVTKAAEPPHPSIGDPALPGAELIGYGAAEPACLVAGSTAEEEAKEATGLTPIVNHMVESTAKKGRPLCTETGLIDLVLGSPV